MIIRSLGFILKTASTEKPTKTIIDKTRYPQRQQQKSSKKPPTSTISAPPNPQLPIDLPSTILNTELTLLQERATPQAITPDWLDNESQRMETDHETRTPRPRVSLFTENTSRGILSAALATQRIGHEIDVARLIAKAVNGQIPSVLPRLMSGTLERGCQLLLNFSDGMVPYWEDLKALAVQVGKVIGKQRVATYEFSEAPGDARRWVPPGSFSAWEPVKGTPVVVATDLGIPDPAVSANIHPSWARFIQKCENVGSPLLILIPWPQNAWPNNLGSYPELIHWNPHTTAAMVRRVIGVGHEVAP